MTTNNKHADEIRKSGFDGGEKPIDSLRFLREAPGQNYPQHYPQATDALGEPLTIREVARLLGCSVWTVRQSYLPNGLPHLRSQPLGKLIFYRNQIVRWILQHQRKGGR
jgi:hypothetical protein